MVVGALMSKTEVGRFESALLALRFGRAVERAGWNGRGMWVRMQEPDEHSKMTLPYLYIKTVNGDLVPWNPSPTDLLADDWQLSEGAP